MQKELPSCIQRPRKKTENEKKTEFKGKFCLECFPKPESSDTLGYWNNYDEPSYNQYFCTNKCARSFSSHAFNPSKEWADHVTERGESVI